MYLRSRRRVRSGEKREVCQGALEGHRLAHSTFSLLFQSTVVLASLDNLDVFHRLFWSLDYQATASERVTIRLVFY